MNKFFLAVALIGSTVGFAAPGFCNFKCSGTLVVNEVHKDAKGVSPDHLEADVTFDSGTFDCKGGSFAKTEKPTQRVAILGFGAGTNKEIARPGAKLKVEYESVYISAADTLGMFDGWDEKWTVLGEQKAAS